MAAEMRFQWIGCRAVAAGMATIALYSAIIILIRPARNDPSDPLISATGYAAAWLWLVTSPFSVRLADRGKVRWLYAAACLFAWLHLAAAFHLGHGWSHAAAFEHTRQVGGLGSGIYFNYLFAAMWTLDALWALFSLGSYSRRPVWLSAMILGFMGFIVVNAAIVFATGLGRWAGLGLFVGCAVAAGRNRKSVPG